MVERDDVGLLNWFRHMDRMSKERLMKRVYVKDGGGKGKGEIELEMDECSERCFE